MMKKLDGLVNELSSLTLLEASQLAVMLRDRWGSTETVAPIMRPAEKIEDAIDERIFSVVLKDIGPKKIEVIKLVRQLNNLGLKEAKDLVEFPLAVLARDIEEKVAQTLQASFSDIGATVELRQHPFVPYV